VKVLLQSDPSLFTKPQTVTVFTAGRQVASVRVPPNQSVELGTRLVPRGGVCTVNYRIHPTAVPAVVTQGQNPDTRVLGIHFTRFSYRSPSS
jgi:hypothetical protein